MGIIIISLLLLPVAIAASAMLNDKWSQKEATVEQNEEAGSHLNLKAVKPPLLPGGAGL